MYTAIGRMRESLNYDVELAKDSARNHGNSTHHLMHSTEQLISEEERLKKEKEKLVKFGRKFAVLAMILFWYSRQGGRDKIETS